METTKVILVNEEDEVIGEIDKMEAHHKGLLHRAFSIFIFDNSGKMLIQQRAESKYHGGLLWTNACCSHPFPGEPVEAAAQRRLEQELGFITSLKEIFSFIYKADVENNLIEHEFDHVFAGVYEGDIIPNRSEVASFKYMTMDEIKEAVDLFPEQYTKWFILAFPKMEAWWQERFRNLELNERSEKI
jgi:isopentenyl-diphosphate delta-isomerase